MFSSAAATPTRTSALKTVTCPFNAHDVSHAFDPAAMSYAEVEQSDKLFALVAAYVARCSNGADGTPPSRIARANPSRGSKGCCDDSDEEEDKAPEEPAELALGLGLFKVPGPDGAPVYCLHQRVGEPVSGDCGGVEMLTALVLFRETAKGGLDALQALCSQLVDQSEASLRKGAFRLHRYNVRMGHWLLGPECAARPMDSVVLPEEIIAGLVRDLEEFFAPGTRRWYREHGIPYRRAYLFHGVPGAGKTSLLQALAGHFRRNLCFLQPSHPELTDDKLQAALQRVPRRSMVVFEDVDAVFDAKRKAKSDKSLLSFSGLLNALDGVGDGPQGQIVILTSNHRERLDPALIRPGRVDVHVPFAHATPEQMRKLFAQFYPQAAPESGAAFAARLVERLAGKEVSMAALQHFFVISRKRAADEAVASLGEIVEELRARDDEAARRAADEAANGEPAKVEAAAPPVLPAPAPAPASEAVALRAVWAGMIMVGLCATPMVINQWASTMRSLFHG